MDKEESKKNKLYIIGNGFDLHHGLKTSYKNFADYLREKDSSLYYLLDSFLSYPTTDKDPWYRFEENLAKLDIDAILVDDEELLPDILSESYRDRDKYIFPDEMRNKLENFTTGLISIFTRFIQEVKTPKSANDLMLDIDAESKYLTFNYTYTLEDLYKINPKNVLHIHNGAESKYADIILGHGTHPDNFKKEINPPDDLSEEDLKNWHEYQLDQEFTPRGEGEKILLEFFSLSFKNTKEIIENHKRYFEELKDINEVFVLGHSLSDVDLLYIEEVICAIDSNAKWTVSYYDESEKIKHLKTLTDYGIKEKNINLIQLEDIQKSNKQEKIQF